MQGTNALPGSASGNCKFGIVIGHVHLFQVAIGRIHIGDPGLGQLLGQAPLMGVEGAL